MKNNKEIYRNALMNDECVFTLVSLKPIENLRIDLCIRTFIVM